MNLDEFKSHLENVLREVEVTSDQTQDSDEAIARILQCTYEEAGRLGHDYIGAEHVLAAIFLAELGKGWQVLEGFGVSLEAVRQETTMLVVCPGLHD